MHAQFWTVLRKWLDRHDLDRQRLTRRLANPFELTAWYARTSN